MKSSPEIVLSYGCPRRGVPAPGSFARWAGAALAVANASGPCQLSIRIVDAAEGAALNRAYRGKDHATNVLSFAADAHLPDGARLLGDLALCAPVVADEAAAQGKRVVDHYAHLCIHGVLHLLGHDHETDAAAAAMEALEISALASLGVANPYESDRQ